MHKSPLNRSQDNRSILKFFVFVIVFPLLHGCTRYASQEIKNVNYSDIVQIEIRTYKNDSGYFENLVVLDENAIKKVKFPLSKLFDKITSDSFLQNTDHNLSNVYDRDAKNDSLNCKIFLSLNPWARKGYYYVITHEDGAYAKISLSGSTWWVHSDYAQPFYFPYKELNVEIEELVLTSIELIRDNQIEFFKDRDKLLKMLEKRGDKYVYFPNIVSR